MSEKKLQQICVGVFSVYLILAVLFFGIAGEQLRVREEKTEAITPSQATGELVQGIELRQPFTVDADEIVSMSLMLSTYARENTSHVQLRLVDLIGSTLAEIDLNTADILDNAVKTIRFTQPIQVTPGTRYELVLTSPDGMPGNAITTWQGNTVSAARTEVAKVIDDSEQLRINGTAQNSMLHFSLQTRSYLLWGEIYWYVVLAGALLLAGYLLCTLRMMHQGKYPLIVRIAAVFQRYGYLMRQLISRDFKIKYKRSVLGVLWSFLNPLLTMLVQYIVFSTLFRSDIPNFPLYLLTGIVCFNFFSEATNMALQSIVGNAALITKVYVPKYIYPVSRVLSSSINLLLSMIPLFAVMLITRTPVRPALLLLPFGVICLVAFCIGMGFILSTTMVFFRDTQFLWGVVSMLWMYATPIFYPESIIPTQYMLLYKCNPLYHIIRFIRILLINGVSPEPKAYLLCVIASFLPLLLGAAIFKAKQDQFVLNL